MPNGLSVRPNGSDVGGLPFALCKKLLDHFRISHCQGICSQMLAVDFIVARSLEGQKGFSEWGRKGGAHCPKELGFAIRIQFGEHCINPV